MPTSGQGYHPCLLLSPTPSPKQQKLAWACPTDRTPWVLAPDCGGPSIIALVPFLVPAGGQLPLISPRLCHVFWTCQPPLSPLSAGGAPLLLDKTVKATAWEGRPWASAPTMMSLEPQASLSIYPCFHFRETGMPPLLSQDPCLPRDTFLSHFSLISIYI